MQQDQKNKFAEIAVPLPIDRVFHYSIPETLSGSAAIGKRVWVEFGHKRQVGYITGFADKADIENIKPIQSIIDSEPIISEELMELAGLIAQNYMCTIGEALHAMVPVALKKGKETVKSRVKAPPALENKELNKPHELTSEQKNALNNILASAGKNESKTFLLYGITASGKTEVYLQAMDEVLKQGKSCIMLVPEISLTPQTVDRVVSRFGENVAVIHSALLGSTRFEEWKKIKNGTARIVVGARSAIFSPVKDLGLIIIDEEHESTYKQEDVPRYHARDVAIWRACSNKCPVILGSATPSLESYYRAKSGVYELLRITKRIDNRALPKVKVVDMRAEVRLRKKLVLFSDALKDELEKVVSKKMQAMVFLNRRGFSTYINCKSCGTVMKCKRCDAVLVYHFDKKELICHYCNYSVRPPNICPVCESGYVNYTGMGTEKVESELARVVPSARIARMDADATSKRGSHDAILKEFRDHKIDILVGTQMITKGHDFPKVTLVGIVNADVTLNMPDFRAGEKTFNLVTQVSGRAGRGDDGGEVVLQTYAPEHYAIVSAESHDFEKFYEQEIKIRKDLAFPPFSNLVRITVRSKDENKARETAALVRKTIEPFVQGSPILGPAPSPIYRVKNYFRWNIIIKSSDRLSACSALRNALRTFRKPAGVLTAVDVDPISV